MESVILEDNPKTTSITELVPWLYPVTDAIVATKASALMATHEIRGLDIDSVNLDHIDHIVERLDDVYHALNSIPGWVWITVRKYRNQDIPDQRFANPGAQALYQIHRQNLAAYAPYRMRSYLTVAIEPTKGMGRLFTNVGDRLKEGEGFFPALWHSLRGFWSSKYAFAYKRDQIMAACNELEHMLDSAFAMIPELGLRRLRGPEFFGFLRSLVSDRMTPDDPLPLDEESLLFLDTRLPDATLEVGQNIIRLGDKYAAALSIKEWPAMTTPAIVRTLMAEDAEITFSFAFRMLNPEEARKTLLRIRQFAEIAQYRLIDYILALRHGGTPPDRKATSARKQDVREAYAALDDFDSGNIAIGYANMTILAYADTPEQCNTVINGIRKRLAILMPGVVREDLHLASAFAATLPGQIDEPVRWILATSRNLSDATWFLLPETGQPENRHLAEQLREPAPCLATLPTEWRTPYHFNFHEGGLGHAMIIGPAGAGKSVMANFLISQWLKYEPCHVVIFDKDKSCYITTLMHGGTHYTIDPDTPMKLNPLHLIADKRHHPFLVDWVVSLIEMRGYQCTTADVKAVAEAIEELHANEAPEHHRLIYLQAQLPSDLKIHLDPYLQSGQYGHLFDNEEDAFSVATITCIEMGDLLRTPYAATPFLEYAFYRITDMLEQGRSAGARPAPTLIYLEECWFVLENPRFAARIKDWLKTLRKLNAILVMTTQSMDDMVAADPKIFAAIRDNIPTKILLPNYNARTESLRKLYRDMFAIPEHYVDRIASAVRNRDYLIVKPNHAKMVWYRFTPEQLAWLRSDSAALSIFEQERQRGPGWEQRYLKRVVEEL